MKILVCMSVVPDTTTKITFAENNTKFNTQGVQFIINPYDELSLSRALEIAEKTAGTVTVLHVGDVNSEPVIRKALAIGANDAIRIDTPPLSGMQVAREIPEVAGTENFDLILVGRESIDYNGGQVCGLLAELLQLPSVNVVSRLEIEGGNAQCTRDIEGGKETVEVPLPCVISSQKDLCEPRIPNMRGIMMARTKPLKVLPASGQENPNQFISYELPPAKTGVKLIAPEDAGRLIELLHSEKKVI